jgi:hypothetical protein
MVFSLPVCSPSTAVILWSRRLSTNYGYASKQPIVSTPLHKVTHRVPRRATPIRVYQGRTRIIKTAARWITLINDNGYLAFHHLSSHHSRADPLISNQIMTNQNTLLMRRNQRRILTSREKQTRQFVSSVILVLEMSLYICIYQSGLGTQEAFTSSYMQLPLVPVVRKREKGFLWCVTTSSSFYQLEIYTWSSVITCLFSLFCLVFCMFNLDDMCFPLSRILQ